MPLLFDIFTKEIASIIHEKISTECQTLAIANSLSESDLYKALTLPPDYNLGQAALPCFIFAKLLKKSPNQIAENLAQAMNAKAHKKYILKAQNVGAYLNLFINPAEIHAYLTLLKTTEKTNSHFFAANEREKIIVEYSQPNTHKAMHVGHLRCLVLGDAVCNLLEYVGHTVVRATYPGDIGTHVAKIIWYLTHPEPKTLPNENRPAWLGRMYAEGDSALKALKGTPLEPQAKEAISTILKQISQENGSYYELWRETRQWSLDYLNSVYSWLGSHFDIWYFESECEKPSKELVKKKYEEGFFTKDNGAIGLDLSAYKLGFAMFLKSDGNGLYITKDLDLMLKKFSDPTITKSIYVVDSRQKLHFEQLFKTAELMGIKQAPRSVHLSYETVNTENGTPFSSRELNGLALFDLRESMENKIKNDYLARYKNDWSEEDIEQTANIVCIGALKYGMLKSDNNTQIHFSLNEWLRLDGETGPYLQYVYARSTSILNKLGTPNVQIGYQFTESLEEELLFFIFRFEEFCFHAANTLRPAVIANYLYDLAKQFNRFYEACPIKDSADLVKNTRLSLVALTRETIQTGLKLLGIPSPLRM